MLVLQSGAIGQGGDLFLLDMGEQVKILDLAKNMIRLAGLVPDKDIAIEFVGIRSGEKLYEELLIEGEDVVDTSFEKIKICLGENGIDKVALSKAIEALELEVNGAGDHDAVLDIIKELVPRSSFSNTNETEPKSTIKILEVKASEGKKRSRIAGSIPS